LLIVGNVNAVREKEVRAQNHVYGRHSKIRDAHLDVADFLIANLKAENLVMWLFEIPDAMPRKSPTAVTWGESSLTPTRSAAFWDTSDCELPVENITLMLTSFKVAVATLTVDRPGSRCKSTRE
jgi:hypothetical protein